MNPRAMRLPPPRHGLRHYTLVRIRRFRVPSRRAQPPVLQPKAELEGSWRTPDDSYFCYTFVTGEVVKWCSKTPVRVCFSRCVPSPVAHQPHLGFLIGCDRELKHGFTFPLFLFRCRGSARYLHHTIMQSCNHVIRRISLWPLIGGEPRSPYPTKPIPGGRSSCVSPRRSFVSMKLMPMPRSQL